METIVTQ